MPPPPTYCLESELYAAGGADCPGDGLIAVSHSPASAKGARDQVDLSIADVEQWCINRSAEPMSASTKLLFAGGSPAEISRRLILCCRRKNSTNGVCQWPQYR